MADDSAAVFNVGSTPDGTIIQSNSGDQPDDDTVVWLQNAPDQTMTVAELEASLPEDSDGLVLVSEPVPEADGAPWLAEGTSEVTDTPAMPPPAAQTAAMTINGEPPTKAMIALLPADDPDDDDVEGPMSGLAVDGGDPPEALHMTMKFLGDADNWPPGHRTAIQACVAGWAAGLHPMKAKVAGAGVLGNEGAAVLHLDAADAIAARADLEARLAAMDTPVDISDTHPQFMPHVTTGYGVTPATDKIGKAVKFDRASVHFGPDVTEYPLGTAKVAAMMSEAQLDEVNRVLTEAEERVGNLEGLVARTMVAGITDEMFDTAPVASVPSPPPPMPDPGLTAATIGPLMARIAALPEDLPPAVAERVQELLARLESLEEYVTELQSQQIVDEEMPEPESDFVNESVDA